MHLVNSRQLFICRIGGYVVVPAEGVVELRGRGPLQALEHSYVSLRGYVPDSEGKRNASYPAVAYDCYNASRSLTLRYSCGPEGTY